MLSNVLQNATERLEKNKTAQDRVRDSEHFESNITKVLQTANKMDMLLRAANEAKQQKLMRVWLEQTLRNDLISTMQSVLEQVQERFLDNEVVRNLSRNTADLKAHLDRCWNQAVSQEAGQVASSLDTFGPFMDQPNEAVALKQSITNRMQELPASSEEVLSFAAKLKKGREMADQAGDDPEIKAFIRKVFANQASLENITPKVQEWIKIHNLERRMKISFI